MPQDPSIARRRFVQSAGGAALLAACGCLASCAGTGGGGPSFPPGPVDIGTAADYPHDGVFDAFAKSRGFFVVREHGRLFAPSAICTHRECLIEKEAVGLTCPCHGSQFTAVGKVTEGPARRSLPRFAITRDAGGKVVVDSSRRFEESQWSDPAAYVAL